MKEIFSIIIILLTFLACEKDKLSPESHCEEIPPLQVNTQGASYQWTNTSRLYGHASFNPNNPNQFVYRTLNDEGEFEMIIYDLVTKEKNSIHSGLIAYFQWGAKDWILFNTPEFKLHIIKSNGDSLTQITDDRAVAAHWNITGDKILYEVVTGGQNTGIIIDINGNPLDTTSFAPGNHSSWQHDSLSVTTGYIGVNIGNPYTGQINTVHEVGEDFYRTGGADWINSEEVIWSYIEGIFKTNIITGETTLLKETCNGRLFFNPTTSVDGKVIFKQVDYKLTSDTGGETRTSLFMMNVDGTEQQIIDLD